MAEADERPTDAVLTPAIRLFTIGFKGRSAEEFFTALEQAGVERVIDIRRTNSSQLSGFTKGRDLVFFLRRCGGIEYEHVPDFAPSEELLREYRTRLGHKKKDDAAWQMYVERYEAEIGERPIAEIFERATGGCARICFLCSEEAPDRCHRRLLAEHIRRERGGVEVEHL